jgi:hypothetical protein
MITASTNPTKLHPASLATVLGIFCSLQAASSVGLSAQQPLRRDSAGIEIVTNGSIADAPLRYIVLPRPIIDIGGLSENVDNELRDDAIVSIARLQWGELAVPNGHTLQIHDGAGRWLRTLGQRGEGPREFRQVIYEICTGVDREFVAVEAGPSRMAVFEDPYTLSGTVRYDGRIAENGCLHDGTLVVQLERDTENPDAPARYVLVNFRGEVLRELGRFPVYGYNRFFERRAHLVGGRGRLLGGDGSTFEYRQYDLFGRLVRIVRTADQPQPFTAADLRELIRKRIPAGTPSSVVDQALRRANGLDRPERWPAYTRLQVDEANRVWIAEPVSLSSTAASWAVFDSTGALLGRVETDGVALPGAAAAPIFLRWGVQEVVVRYFDSDGAIHVAVLPLGTIVGSSPVDQ